MTEGINIGSGPYQGRFADVRPLTLANAVTFTEGGPTRSVELGDRRVARLTLTIENADLASLEVAVEVSRNGVDWYTSGAFAPAAEDGSQEGLFMLDRFVRANLSLDGTTADVTIAGEVV
ncbi:MAG: hypothetical protein AAGA56_19180, partial [Myxococcota bacterium]